MSEKDIEQMMRRLMSEWPPYRPEYSLFAIELEDRGWSLGYCAPRARIPFGTHWDANIVKNVFYLLHIQIAKKFRGQGHGDALYKIIEHIADECGCCAIRQHPSGNTQTGETRRDYLLRRGWLPNGVEVYKPLFIGCID